MTSDLSPFSASAAARSCLAVVLAAGEGTRMRSTRPKVLHEVAGRSMLAHVLAAVQEAGASRIAVVVGPDHEAVRREAERAAPGADTFIQPQRLGTAHAVLAAREALARGADDVVIAFADTPLIEATTLSRLRAPLAAGAAVAVLGFEARDPTGYGRLITEPGGRLVAIREERDASPEERRLTLCNAGLMALRGDLALDLLTRIGNRNAKGEYYLTDAVALAVEAGLSTVAVPAHEEVVRGVNDRAQLAMAEAAMQARLRRAAMAEGATLIAPDTVFFSHDTKLGRDVLVEPHVFFGRGVQVGDRVTIHAFCHFEGARIADGAEIGPYARFRPGAVLGPGSKAGNFVEIKNAEIGPGAKVNHLSYVGDSTVGEKANIGAGTITCNYDGVAKHRTVIGRGAFIGSNSALVAPVTVADGAYVASGSVITDDVPADALALGRARQVVKEGRAAAFRAEAGRSHKD